MLTVRFFRRDKNQWKYLFSRQFDSLHDVEDIVNDNKLQAHVYDQLFKKVKVISPKSSGDIV